MRSGNISPSTRVVARIPLNSAVADDLSQSGLYDPAQKTRIYHCVCHAVSHTSLRLPGTWRQHRRLAHPTPAPTPAGSLQSVNHIIFMMQENRSFDSYFGKINDYRASLGLGRDADDLETDFTNPTDSPDTQQIRTFHLATSCIYNTTAGMAGEPRQCQSLRYQ